MTQSFSSETQLLLQKWQSAKPHLKCHFDGQGHSQDDWAAQLQGCCQGNWMMIIVITRSRLQHHLCGNWITRSWPRKLAVAVGVRSDECRQSAIGILYFLQSSRLNTHLFFVFILTRLCTCCNTFLVLFAIWWMHVCVLKIRQRCLSKVKGFCGRRRQDLFVQWCFLFL